MAHYQRFFPEMTTRNHRQTSAQTNSYNCIAWAAGDNTRWWQPDVPFDLGYYWPPAASAGWGIHCLIEAFQAMGFEQCADAAMEPGVSKIALYADAALEWTHAARQLDNGKWTSKLGPAEDIEHDTPDTVAGPAPAYGSVFCFMSRPQE